MATPCTASFVFGTLASEDFWACLHLATLVHFLTLVEVLSDWLHEDVTMLGNFTQVVNTHPLGDSDDIHLSLFHVLAGCAGPVSGFGQVVSIFVCLPPFHPSSSSKMVFLSFCLQQQFLVIQFLICHVLKVLCPHS